MSDKHWVCVECGNLQAEQGVCQTCKHDNLLDTRDERVRELMRDIDLRAAQRREGKFRFIGVAVGMVTIFGLWLVPGYWNARGKLYPGLPMLLDQWAMMALIGFGTSKLLEKIYNKKKFPYLDDSLNITS